MNRLMLAGLLLGLCAASGRAEADVAVGARYVDLDSKWNKGQALEYDGKQYRGAHGDVSVGNQSELGLFDFSLKDIGSHEEDVSFNLDYKSTFKASAKWTTLHHRMNPLRHGQVVNGVWRPNNIALTDGSERFTYRTQPINFSADPNGFDFKLKRVESEVNLGLFVPENSARWATVQYWNVSKTGSRFVQTATNILGEADVSNTQTNLTLGLGTNIMKAAAVSVDFIQAEFSDNAGFIGTTSASNIPILPKWPGHKMSAVESKWRYDVNKKLSLTGALTGRQRENLSNLYKFNAGVAAFNAAYRATSKLSLTARTYLRYFEVDENPDFRGLNGGAVGNTHQLDKLTARGEIMASYRPVKRVHTKATYKVELNNRRDAPSEDFTTTVVYENGGLVVPANTRSNNVSHQDLKHILRLAAAVDLPHDAEFEAEYTKLQANRPAFINMPTRKDEVGAQFMVPLPARVELTLGTTYSKERNANAATNYHLSRNAYRAGLDWERNGKVFVGVDGSYETIRYNTNEYYQSTNNPGTVAGTGNVNLPYEEGALQRQRNTTLGAHVRAACPKGFVVLGNGSYTWSVVRNPVNFGWTAAEAATLAATQYTPGDTYVNDIMPSEVRIARGTLGLEYTPEKFKNLTARASYTITDWVDRVDRYNSGRASVAQVGASMKF